MELPIALEEAIKESANIEKELGMLLDAKTDAEMLMAAHQIRAKYEVKQDIVSSVIKCLYDNK